MPFDPDDLFSEDGEWMLSTMVGDDPVEQTHVYVSVETLLEWQRRLDGNAEAVMATVESVAARVHHEIVANDTDGGMGKALLFGESAGEWFRFDDICWMLDRDRKGVPYIAIELADHVAARLFGDKEE